MHFLKEICRREQTWNVGSLFNDLSPSGKSNVYCFPSMKSFPLLELITKNLFGVELTLARGRKFRKCGANGSFGTNADLCGVMSIMASEDCEIFKRLYEVRANELKEQLPLLERQLNIQKNNNFLDEQDKDSSSYCRI